MVGEKQTAMQRWKEKHRDYYLAQKRRLAARPEYKAHRREKYRKKCQELTLLGILPRKRGRPQLYLGEEAVEMRRQRAREASMRYRLKLISLLEEKEDNTSETASQSSIGSGASGWRATDSSPQRDWAGSEDTHWAFSTAGG